MKKGIALISVVMIVMILTLMGLAFLNMSGLENILSKRQNFYLKALNIAEAGLERALWKLTKQPNWRSGWNNISFDDGYYKVTLSDQSDGTILIISTGYCKNISKTVKATVRVSSSSSSPSISFTLGTSLGNLGDFPGSYGDIGQSFTTGSSQIKVARVEMQIKKDNPNVSDIYMTIRSGSTVGQILGTSNIIPNSQIPSGNALWISFNFDPPVLLQPNTKYYLRLSSIPPSTNPYSGAQGKIHLVYANPSYRRVGGGHTSSDIGDGLPSYDEPGFVEVSPYVYGEAYRYIGRNNNPSYPGEVLNHDFNFRIFSTSSGSVNIINWTEEPYNNF
ncbi:MAG: pilus assembly PilX N-terminal domain-containing protein [Candidatus Omnitrophica bacterium]|nr:pilus assembly PilX N-terminal domain-containing protein [Candidatus Omnitrophota bacterium]